MGKSNFEVLSYVLEHKFVKELILHVGLNEAPPVVPDSSDSGEDGQLGVSNAFFLLMPQLQDQLG